MELKDILEKLKGKEVDSAVIDAVKALDQSSEIEKLSGELTAEKGKNAGILEDKRKFKERAETAEGELKKIGDSKLTDEERTKKLADETNEKLAELQAKLDQKDQDYIAEKRELGIAGIAAKLKTVGGVDPSIVNMMLKAQLKDIDLTDESKVAEITSKLKETNKALFAADVPKGSDSHHEQYKGGDGDKTATTEGAVSSAWG